MTTVFKVGINTKLSGVDRGISTYKTYCSEFRFRWPEVRSILRPIRQWENVQMSFFSESVSKNVLPIKIFSYWIISMFLMRFWTYDLSFLSFEVIRGKIRSLPLTFDRIEIERWEWAQSVPFAKTHRLIYNTTHLIRHVTSRDIDMSSNFEIGLFRSTCTYFDAFRREEHDAAKIMSFLSSNAIR